MNQDYKMHAFEMLRKMEQFCTTTNCRRYLLLSYFDKKTKHPETPDPECCDNCFKQSEKSSTDLSYGLAIPKVEFNIRNLTILRWIMVQKFANYLMLL